MVLRGARGAVVLDFGRWAGPSGAGAKLLGVQPTQSGWAGRWQLPG